MYEIFSSDMPLDLRVGVGNMGSKLGSKMISAEELTIKFLK